MDSARSRSCEEKYCWFRDGGSGGTGGDGEACRRACETNLRDCRQPRASVAYSPLWCSETLDECFAKCSGTKKPEPEGCRGIPPNPESICVKEGGAWTWKVPEKPDFCKMYPEKCRKPELPGPGTCEEKIAALQQKISTLDEQVTDLKDKRDDAKDAVTEKNDEIRALQKEKAPRAEINVAKKELKALKRAVSKIVSQGKKLSRELRFTEDKYSRLQHTCSPQVY